ncbi:MAG: BatA domain-containing protein, partial [Pseudomonadota bacterium]
MSLFGLSFAAPALLFGLLALPLIWWLLRLTPPRPREEVFPPTRILAEIEKQEETPANSPWWLTLLRLLMAGLIVLALAEPILNAREDQTSGTGPALIMLDDTWSTGANWDARVTTTQRYLEEFAASGRPVALAFSSLGARADFTPRAASELLPLVAASEPQPVQPDNPALAAALVASETPFGTIVLLSSGLNEKNAPELMAAVTEKSAGEVIVVRSETATTWALGQLENRPDVLVAPVVRASSGDTASGTVGAFDRQGRLLGQAPFSFGAGDTNTNAEFALPVELRNDIARVEINGSSTAGAVQLLDERFRRRRVGLIAGGNADRDQPLLSPLYFISKALAPFSDVREADSANVVETVERFLNERISTLVLADIGRIPTAAETQLREWLDNGGTLIRFAGPRLAAAEDDALVPVTLRRGGRSLGGTLTWGTPQKIVSFEADSPFAGIQVPEDVAVTRQVLAEPGIDLRDKTWASLEDGTPLVSAARFGKGTVILFHVTADASWSN